MRLKFGKILLLIMFLGTQNIHAFDLSDMREKRKELQERMLEKSNAAQKHCLKIDECRERVDEIQKEMQPYEDEYLRARKVFEKVDAHFKHRMTEIYKKGETGYLSTLASAPSFPDFLDRLITVRLIAKEDYKLVEERREAANKVALRKKVYDDKIQEVQKIIEEGQKEYLALQKELDKERKGLEEVQHIEEEHFDEIVKINLKDWNTGKLRFPYIGPLEYPIKGHQKGRESSQWGHRRDPFNGRICFHAGIDFAYPRDTPVYAAADGVVVSSKASSGYGWLITVYHGEVDGKSIFTRYAHSYPRQVQVVVGQQVYRGQTQLTSVGSNGFSTGDHLHFEVRVGKGDSPPSVDPKKWLRR